MSSKEALKQSEERSLLVLVVDVSPVVWNVRDLKRTSSDMARFEKGKTSVGPAILEECLKSVQAFCGAFWTLQRESTLTIIAVAGNETAMVFPRKDALETYFSQDSKMNVRKLAEQLANGVSELVSRPGVAQDTAAMAAGVSLALCIINRFLVANAGGVSALLPESAALFRQDDEGILSVMGSGHKRQRTSKAGAWSPRILIIQASNDRSNDYNAFMNCAFAAVKHNIVIDGCFIPSGLTMDPKNSSFLEQACDRSGGVYLAPSGMAQVGPALTEILFSIFLAPRSARSVLNLPAIHKVDFRARCFDTGETVSMAYVCNQCLSIFKYCPKGQCPTCGAKIQAHK
jgi:transcription initiation factor TFIIH subunit 3